jgi:hypothetical protein
MIQKRAQKFSTPRHCHAEQREASRVVARETLRFAQGDKTFVKKAKHFSKMKNALLVFVCSVVGYPSSGSISP